MALFLGIDTSNYTTSTAIYNSETNEIIQCKKLLPVKEGQLGLRQSDAVFHHTQQLPQLFCELMKIKEDNKLSMPFSAVGVSSRPRNIDGSYMPCFTVGSGTATVLSSALNVPLYEFSHQQGHIVSALYSAEKIDLLDKKFLAFHVSGGTTEALLVNSNIDINVQSLNIKLVAKTLDLNAGQAVDRVGLMLNLKFPCGKELERLAVEYINGFDNKDIKSILPPINVTLKNFDCCLSGLENICAKMKENGESSGKIALFCLMYIEKTLEKMTQKLIEKYGDIPVVFAGGVMSNSIIKEQMQKRFNAIFAKPEFSTDNAAGIAILAYLKSRG